MQMYDTVINIFVFPIVAFFLSKQKQKKTFYL